MADSNPGAANTTNNTPNKLEEAPLVPQEMSLEDIDKLLEQEDPEFLKSVQNIGEDKELKLEGLIVDDAKTAYRREVKLWEGSTGLTHFIYKIIPFVPVLSFSLKILKFKLKAFRHAAWIWLKTFLEYIFVTGHKKIISGIKYTLSAISNEISSVFEYFFELTRIQQLVSIFTILFSCLFIFAVYKSVKDGLLPLGDEMFLTGFTHHSAAVYDYNPKTEVEPYFDNARAAQNIVLLDKIVVNLKPSAQSGPNPMGAFEFFVEGMTSDVIIEVKDREYAIRDAMQNIIGDMTFDVLDTTAGKKELCLRLKKAITSVLTTGSIKNVRIKTIVIKP